MTDSIDSLVKGAPLPGSPNPSAVVGTTPVNEGGDPLSHTPSSPSMIYLNLLILETSLRAQYLDLRARRRHHTFFLALLTLWVCGFGYALFLAPREDGQGHGGSVYWGVEVAEQVCFVSGIITAILVWGTGIWDRGVRWPRRWFAVSNRGLRGFNCKLVLMRRPWWAEVASVVGFFLTYGLFSHTASSSYRCVDPAILRDVEKELNTRTEGQPALPILVEDEERGVHEEDLAPGGNYVKLLLLPKHFTATFRENWELYRAEYWEKENERRALLRDRMRAKGREFARQKWGLLWWFPWHRAEISAYLSRERLPSRTPTPRSTPTRQHGSASEHAGRARRNSVRRGSMSSSRSQTPTVEAAEEPARPRKLSSGSATPEKARKRLSATGSFGRSQKRPDSRSATPENPSPLGKESVVGAEGPADAAVVRKMSSRSSVGSMKEKEKGRS